VFQKRELFRLGTVVLIALVLYPARRVALTLPGWIDTTMDGGTIVPGPRESYGLSRLGLSLIWIPKGLSPHK
jgi:hypothetical protein